MAEDGSEPFEEASLEQLPDEVLQNILGHSDILALLEVVSMTSRRLRAAVLQPAVWRHVRVRWRQGKKIDLGRIKALAGPGGLEGLTVARSGMFMRFPPPLTDRDLVHLGPRLTTLLAAGCTSLTPAGLSKLPWGRWTVALDLSDVHAVDDNLLLHIAKKGVAGLQTLALGSSNQPAAAITHAGLGPLLAAAPALRVLDLGNICEDPALLQVVPLPAFGTGINSHALETHSLHEVSLLSCAVHSDLLPRPPGAPAAHAAAQPAAQHCRRT